MKFLVTTQASDIPTDVQIVMVDGTVPGWQPKPGDEHFDHHRPGGADIQIDEIPQNVFAAESATFATTQLDADACAAAAWILLLNMENVLDETLEKAKRYLRAIAYDCDHLGLPPEQEFIELEKFARDAVASLKLTGPVLAKEWGYPADKKTWTREQKVKYYSRLFEQGTNHLVNAALGEAMWPGERGEAWSYWNKFEEESEFIRAHCRMYRNVAILDVPACVDYADPRHLVEWARCRKNHLNITLTVSQRPLKLWRDSLEKELVLYDETIDKEAIRSGQIGWLLTVPAFKYTLGSVPLHPDGCPNFSDGRNLPVYDFDCDAEFQPLNTPVWDVLSSAEKSKREWLNFPQPATFWGGRNAVGGSSWNDSAVLMPEEVIDFVLDWNKCEFVPYAEF